MDEIVLTLGDVLSRIPSPYLKLGQHDPKRELRFSINDLSSDIARGRAAVPLSRIAQLVPDIFVKEISADEDTEVRLPLQKLVEQIGLLRSRPAGERAATRQSASSSSAGTTQAPPSFKVEFPEPLIENASPGPDTLSGMLSTVDPVFELKPAEGSVFLRPSQEPTFELKPSAELAGTPFTLAPETPPVAQPSIPSSEKAVVPETQNAEPAAKETREASPPKEAPKEAPKIEIGEFEKIFAQFETEAPAQTSKIESVTPELPPSAAVDVSSFDPEPPPVAEKSPSLVEATAPSVEAAPPVVEKVGASAEPLRPTSEPASPVVTEPILPSSDSLPVNPPPEPEPKIELATPVAAEVVAPRPAKEVVIMAAPVQLRPSGQTPPPPAPPAVAGPGLPAFESMTSAPPVVPLVASDLPSADTVSKMEILAQPVEKASPPVAADLAMPAPTASPVPVPISAEVVSTPAGSTPPAEIAPSSIPKLPFIERLLSAVSAPPPAEEIPTGSGLSPLLSAAPIAESKDLVPESPVVLSIPSVERVDVAPVPEAPFGLPAEASSSVESKPQVPLESAIPSAALPGQMAAPLAPIAEPSTSLAEPEPPRFVEENAPAAPSISIPALPLVPDGGKPTPLSVETLTANVPREQGQSEVASTPSLSRPEVEIASRPVVEPRAAELEPSQVAPEKSAVLPVAQTAAPEAPRIMHPEFADPGREYAAAVLAGTVLPKETIVAAPSAPIGDGPKRDTAPESTAAGSWPDCESVEGAGTPVGLEDTVPEAAPAPEKKVASAEPPQIPPVVVRESPAPADTGRERIQLSLAAILKQCPRELIVGALPAIPDSVRITLPFAPIDRQLVAGHVEISAVRFIAAIPFTYQKYFTARIGVKVPIPLEEVFQNLPNPSKEEPVVSGPAPQILAPAVPEDLVIPDEVIPPPPPIILAGPTPVAESTEPVPAVEPHPVPVSAIAAPTSTRPVEETPSTAIPVSATPSISEPVATAPSTVAPFFTIPIAAAPVSATPVGVRPTTVVPSSETVPVADVPPLESAAEPALATETAPEPVADVAQPEVGQAPAAPEALTPESGVVPVIPAIPDTPVVEMVTLVAPSTLPAEPESISVSAPAVTALDLSMGHHIVPPPPIVIPEPEATEAEIPLAGTPFDGVSEEGATQLAPIELAPAAKVETESGPHPIEPSPTKFAQDVELHAPKPEHDAEPHAPKPELEVEAPLPEHQAASETPQAALEAETPPTISAELPPNVPIGDTPEPVTNMDEQVISPTELEKPADTTPKAEEQPVAMEQALAPETPPAEAGAAPTEAPTLSVAGETTQTFRLPQMIRPMIVLPPPIFGFNPTPTGTDEGASAEPENKAVEPEILPDKEKEVETPAISAAESVDAKEAQIESVAAPAAAVISEAPVEPAQQGEVSLVTDAVDAPAPAVADAAISSEPIQDTTVVEILPPQADEAAAVSAEEKSTLAPRTFVMEGQFVESPRAAATTPAIEPATEAAPADTVAPAVAADTSAAPESTPASEAPAAEVPAAPVAEELPAPVQVAPPTESVPVVAEVAPSAEAIPSPEVKPIPEAAPVLETTPTPEAAGEPVQAVTEAPGAELASAAPIVEPAASSDAAAPAAPIPATEPDQVAASLGIPEAVPAMPVEGEAGEAPLLHLPRIIEQFADTEVLPPPALPLRRFDQDALQALFMTEEVLDLTKISRMAAQLPGVHACVIATRDQACTGGTLPEGFDLAALLGLAPRVGEAAGRMPIGALKHFTLYGERYSVSFFARNGLSLCAVHRPRSFVPGVREKLVAIADELSK